VGCGWHNGRAVATTRQEEVARSNQAGSVEISSGATELGAGSDDDGLGRGIHCSV